VTDTELRTIENICLRSLMALSVMPEFAVMTAAEELDVWFNDRILGGTDS
jgi:hypothetical protein